MFRQIQNKSYITFAPKQKVLSFFVIMQAKVNCRRYLEEEFQISRLARAVCLTKMNSVPSVSGGMGWLRTGNALPSGFVSMHYCT